MGKRKRRAFSDEFKREAAGMVLDGGLSIAEVSRDLDLTETSLRNWVHKVKAERTNGTSGSLSFSEREELAQLRRDNKVLREEREILRKGSNLLREPEPVRFMFVHAEKANHPVVTLCRVMQVSPSGYYAWCVREPSARAQQDGRLRLKIRAFYKQSRCTYDAPRLLEDLREDGERVSQKRVARLMREDGPRGLCARLRDP